MWAQSLSRDGQLAVTRTLTVPAGRSVNEQAPNASVTGWALDNLPLHSAAAKPRSVRMDVVGGLKKFGNQNYARGNYQDAVGFYTE